MSTLSFMAQIIACGLAGCVLAWVPFLIVWLVLKRGHDRRWQLLRRPAS